MRNEGRVWFSKNIEKSKLILGSSGSGKEKDLYTETDWQVLRPGHSHMVRSRDKTDRKTDGEAKKRQSQDFPLMAPFLPWVLAGCTSQPWIWDTHLYSPSKLWPLPEDSLYGCPFLPPSILTDTVRIQQVFSLENLTISNLTNNYQVHILCSAEQSKGEQYSVPDSEGFAIQ